MAKNNNLTDFLTDVANTIRAKKGSTDPINPQNFSSEINSIPKFSVYEEEVTITADYGRTLTFSGLPKGKYPYKWEIEHTGSWNGFVQIAYLTQTNYLGDNSGILTIYRNQNTSRNCYSTYTGSDVNVYVKPTIDFANGSMSFYAGSVNWYFYGTYRLRAIYQN